MPKEAAYQKGINRKLANAPIDDASLGVVSQNAVCGALSEGLIITTLSHMVATKVSGLPPEKVHIHTTLLGCGLGRRPRLDQLIEAVIASKASGKPVKVVYTREEDIQTDYFRSAMAHRINGGLDNRNHLVVWDHKVSSISLIKHLGGAPKDGIDGYCLWGLWDKPGSPVKAKMTYEFPNFSV